MALVELVWVATYPPSDNGTAQEFFAAEKTYQKSLGSQQSAGSTEEKSFAFQQAVFAERLTGYKDGLRALSGNIGLQLLLIASSIAIFLTRTSTFNVPVLNQKVPVKFVHLALPASLGYIWLNFGFLLNHIIADRIALWRLSEAMEPVLEAIKKTDFTKWERLCHVFSHRTLLYDGGIIDGWFLAFRSESTISNAQATTLIAVLTFGFAILLGISNGCILGVICLGCKRFAKSEESRLFYALYFWTASTVLGMSHYAFYVKQANWVSHVTVATCCMVTIFFAVMPSFTKTVQSREWLPSSPPVVGE